MNQEARKTAADVHYDSPASAGKADRGVAHIDHAHRSHSSDVTRISGRR